MATVETAILAGGCFWGMQDLIRKLPGVTATRVGYSGGDVPYATYRNHGSHAEAIEISFDPARMSGAPIAPASTTGRTSSAASPRRRSPTRTPPASGRCLS